MKPETKLKKLLAAYGRDDLLNEPIAPTEEQQLISRESEAVLSLLEGREVFIERACLFCQRHFKVNLASVAYCSDECRAKRLQEMGIDWNPERSQTDRWNGSLVLPENLQKIPQVLQQTEARRLNNVPLVVGPEALNLLDSQPVQNEEDNFQEFLASLDSDVDSVSLLD